MTEAKLRSFLAVKEAKVRATLEARLAPLADARIIANDEVSRAALAVKRVADVGADTEPEVVGAFAVWRPGRFIERLRSQVLKGNAPAGTFDFDFAAGLTTFPRPVTIIASSCGSIGPDSQRTWQLPLLSPGTPITTVEGADHRFPSSAPQRRSSRCVRSSRSD